MESLIARSAALDTAYKLAWATDTLDRNLFLSLFIPDQTVTLDASGHLDSQAPVNVLPDELWKQTVAVVAGFTGTQHVLGNPIITLDEDDQAKARIKAFVTAYHSMGADSDVQSVTARVVWELDLLWHEERWWIRRLVIQRPIPMDNPKLYEIAQEKYKKGQGRNVQIEGAGVV